MNKVWLAVSIVGSALAASAAGLTADNYVQDGLLVHFDGIDNVGTGTHDGSATVWKDLVGSASLTPGSSASWGARCFDTGGTVQQITGAPSGMNTSLVTCEAAVHLVSIARTAASGNVWPFMLDIGDFVYHGVGNSSRQMRLFINGEDPRPNSGAVYTNTLTGVSDAASRRWYMDGVAGATSAPVSTSKNYPNGKSVGTTYKLDTGYAGGAIHTRWFGLRVYGRTLTPEEIAQNAVVDQLRFWAPRHDGTGAEETWSTLSWLGCDGDAVAVKGTATNGYAVIANASVSVTAADKVGLMGLSLEDGATLALDSDAVLAVKDLYVEGVRMARGIYTGSADSTRGTQVSWISGEGVVRVAGALSRAIPFTVVTPQADGWYQFGITSANGGAHLNGDRGYISTTEYNCLRGHYVKPTELGIPYGSKLRIVGYAILDQLPVGMFSELDLSKSEFVVMRSDNMWADGTPYVIPPATTNRWQHGTWVGKDDTPNTYWLVNGGTDPGTYSGDIELNGVLHVTCDNTHMGRQIFKGDFTGNGSVLASSYGNQIRFDGPFGFTGTALPYASGCFVWVNTTNVTAHLTAVTCSTCQGTYSDTLTWCAAPFAFGLDGSAARAENELYIGVLNGNASRVISSDKTKTLRRGGEIIVWGSNTVHVGTLNNGIHAVASKQDQDCTRGWLDSLNAKGPGFLVVDNFASGTLYGSTNVSVIVGTAAAKTAFDYTCQSNNVNRMLLDITNACAGTVTLKATDIAMLPARVSGFAGTVTLTDTETKAYTMPVDFSHGTNVLYNTAGCIGSGTLAAAPASGSINAVFDASPTTANPVRGDYALARFTSGGEKLANWTVTLNGAAVESVPVRGMIVSVRKDSTGLWLAVRRSGTTLIVR